MPQRDTSGIGERVPRELIEADFSIASSFVEMAEEESRRNNRDVAAQLLEKAEQMLEGVRARLTRMTAQQKETFEPRCDELGAAIERVKTKDFSGDAEPEA